MGRTRRPLTAVVARSLTRGATARPITATPEQAAVFATAASVPASFERSLLARNWVDQGILTGASLVATYGMTALAQDVIDVAVSRVAQRYGFGEARQRVSTGASNLAAIGVGLAVRQALPRRHDERMARAALRAAGSELARGGTAGFAAAATAQLAASLPGARWRARMRGVPAIALAGSLVSAAFELRRRRGNATATTADGEELKVSVGRSLATGAGVSVGILVVASGERLLAGGVQRGLDRLLRPSPLWRLGGHAVALGLYGAGVYTALRRNYRGIESGAGKPEPGLDSPPDTPYVSGGPGSHVPFGTLSREGRRHVLSYVRPEWVAEVMGEPAVAHPIRVYVGLDSAPTKAERVRLALAELRRTDALDRSLLVLVSPTGTGYVNYAAIETAEYLTRGDVATVTMQYSKRPSPLSLDRVVVGREQNRALTLAIHELLYARPPERRPRVVLFGESLGAHTSQDVFLHWGTSGMEALGIDRALWIGTPYGSGWKDQVLGPPRPDVERSMVGVFPRIDGYEALPDDAREQLRYVMLTHDNDPVAYFGLDLLVRRPDWLTDARPPGVPPSMRWVPVTTFLHTLVDLKNASHEVPGQFVAVGHDYRADLAEFVRVAYGLSATPEQMASVEQALRRFEKSFFGYIEREREAAQPSGEPGRAPRVPQQVSGRAAARDDAEERRP